MTQLIQKLETTFPNFEFEANYPLAEKTYFKLGGPAEVFIELAIKKEIVALVRFCQKENIKLTIFGGGSNLIIADQGISGLVLNLKNNGLEKIKQNLKGDQQLFRAQAGLKTAFLVRQTVDLGFTGLEPFLGVPGTVGGAVYNNAHYLENLISQYIYQVEIINEAGQIEVIDHDQCQFSYDHSRFQQTNEVILSADFTLKPGNKKESEKLIKKATLYRAKTQPLGQPSSGCIFKNTPNTAQLKKRFPQFSDRAYLPAGFLIDQAGLKGTQVGDIQVSNKHAAFMINLGEGTTQELKKLIELVKKEVKNKFGVELKEEVFYLS